MYSRVKKESHLDTIRYEIDMLDFCYLRLMTLTCLGEQGDANVFFEGFLLHYRNLLAFLTGDHCREKDLSIRHPEVWARRPVTDSELETIRSKAEELDKLYYQDISCYVQHLTEKRASTDRGWMVEEMYKRLAPLLDRFEDVVPRLAFEQPRQQPRLQAIGEPARHT